MSAKNTLSRKMARGLGWFSIGLGLVELLSPGRTARTVGLTGGERLLRSYGLREMVTGVGLLASKNPSPWMWARVVGDVADAATVGVGGYKAGMPAPRKTAMALTALAGVLLLDAAVAVQSTRRASRSKLRHDYSDRSGWPSASPDEMRGRAAGEDLEGAGDLRTPTALRPYLH